MQIDTETFKPVKLIVLGIVGLVVFAILWPFGQVPTGHRGVVTQFGKIVGVETEGLVILPPWQKLNIFNVRAEQADVEKADGATADTQPVSVSLTVRYRIQPDKVTDVFENYSRDGNLDSYVATATQEVFKAVTARYVATDLISKRQAVSNDIAAGLKLKLAQYGAQVVNIDMRNFAFSGDYMAAINEKVTQEQKKLAAENKLKTVEAEQKQKVAIAEAEAKATVATAEATAKSLSLQNDALARNKDVLELRRIEVEKIKAEKWNGQLPQNIYAGAPVPFLNVGK
jgi:regulator of protease activity HflC (stomatin/prohibitin superfamily)